MVLSALVVHKQKKQALKGRRCREEAMLVEGYFWDDVWCVAALEQAILGLTHVIDATRDVMIGIGVRKK